MKQTITCDIAIIGAGAGGLSVAAVASQLGLKVILAESRKMGGDCLNAGCVPSKALLAAAKAAHNMTRVARFGIQSVAPTVDFAAVMTHVADVIASIEPHDSVERFTKLGVQVLLEHAEFIDKHTLRVGDKVIKARYFVVATGSSPSIPPISGIDEVPYLTNETIFSLKEKPTHLIIIGAGPIGCEMAQAFSYLGVSVTLLEAASMMPRDDAEMVDRLRNEFRQSGITIHENIKIHRITKCTTGVEITINKNGEDVTMVGSHLLVAAGRKANVEQLALANAGVKFTPKGIEVDQRLRSTNKRIFAIGDVAGSYQFTHIAGYHAGIVIKNIVFKWPANVNYQAIPWVTYTSPPLAHAGLTSAEAARLHPDCKTITVPYADNDRAIAEREAQGFIKVICSNKGVILGVSILGMNADELLTPWIMLIKDGKRLRDLSDTVIPYPTISEISKRVASEFYSPLLFSAKVKRLVSWIKWF